MEISHFYPATTTQEVETYGKVRFTPINVEFFIRLMDWHQKSFGDVQKTMAALADKPDAQALLAYQEMLTYLVHTATYPFKKDEVSFESWKNTVTGWVLTRPAFVEWFMGYFQKFLPEGGSKGKSRTP